MRKSKKSLFSSPDPKRVWLVLLFATFSFAGTIKVAVAANVSYAIEALVKDFNKQNTNSKIEINIGSSGKLAAQIMQNAPYDIFMSADMGYPEALYSKGLAVSKPKVYANGSLALFTKRGDINVSKGLSTILDDNIKRVAVANPKTAPYGVATKQALKNAKLYDRVKQKFIYGQSIGQTLTYALTAADIGFVAKSTLLSKKLSQYKEGKNWIDVPAKLYTPTKQGIVLIKRAKDSADAKAFYNYILSDRAKEIFKKFGYIYR